ncbi:MAG: hypothetical protein ACLQFR_24430 [Streptosporangiaceae bacterium]
MIGSGELNAGMLQFQTRDILQRIAGYGTGFETWSGSAGAAAQPLTVARQAAESGPARPGMLPRRRPAAP